MEKDDIIKTPDATIGVVKPQQAIPVGQPSVSSSRSTAWVWGLLLILLVCVGIIFSIALSVDDVREEVKKALSPYIVSADSIGAINQSLSATMVIKNVTLTKPGFVVATYHSYKSTDPDVILTQSEIIRMPKGNFKDMPITVNVEAATNYGVDIGSVVSFVLYHDNGDGVFDKNTDTEVKNILGDVVHTDIIIQ